MTYPPQPADPHLPPSDALLLPQESPRNRLRSALIVAVVALILIAVVLAIVFSARSDKLTSAGAQRACRTAVEQEWERRRDIAEQGDTSNILPSTQGIDLDETWESGDGWKVNATVRYTLTAFVVGPVENTLSLTCTASGSDDDPVTSVTNRS